MTWRLAKFSKNMSQYAGHMADQSMRTASGSPARVSSRATAAPSARPIGSQLGRAGREAGGQGRLGPMRCWELSGTYQEPELGRDGGSVRIALSSSSVIAAH